MAQVFCWFTYILAFLLLVCSLRHVDSALECNYKTECSESIESTNYAIEISCNTTALTIKSVTAEDGALQALELLCKTINGTVRVELLCDWTKYLNFVTQTIFFLALDKSSLIEEQISPGDECYVRGCYEKYLDYSGVFNSFKSDNCTIPKNCVWSPWGNWTECDKECGGGLQNRSRYIEVEAIGIECNGSSAQQRTCNTQLCPENCVWSPWGNWTECDKECGGGLQNRSRFFEVEAVGGGLECNGSPAENKTCNAHQCPILT